VQFDPAWGPSKPVLFKQLVDWTQYTEENIKYYSGTATYYKSFLVTKNDYRGRLFLDLGKLTAMAKVKLNGKYIGGVWTAPYQLDISNRIRAGTNRLEIAVVNNWRNRIIGDSKLPKEEQKTWETVNSYKPDSPLQPSGLLGPVTLKTIKP
jgi:hypothetical protein